jgi:transketolase
LRLVSVPVEVPFTRPDDPLVAGRGSWLRRGRDVVIAGAGPVVLSEAWRAAELLEADSIDAGVLELPFLNRVDGRWLEEAVGDAELWVVDNHYVGGGQGSFVAAALAGLPLAVRLHLVGIEEVPACGGNDEVLRHHRLDAASLRERVHGR